MKKLIFLLLVCLQTSFLGTSLFAQNAPKTSDIEVLYFHYTRRCATCLEVEKNSKAAVSLIASDKVKAGQYSFKSINLDDASADKIAKKFKIGGQALIVVKGDKKCDITNIAFMNSDDPQKIKEEIKKAVDKIK
jgi:hypothetical protein